MYVTPSVGKKNKNISPQTLHVQTPSCIPDQNKIITCIAREMKVAIGF
jgi:hypothetical protein